LRLVFLDIRIEKSVFSVITTFPFQGIQSSTRQRLLLGSTRDDTR
jgi:hypothetical protein